MFWGGVKECQSEMHRGGSVEVWVWGRREEEVLYAGFWIWDGVLLNLTEFG